MRCGECGSPVSVNEYELCSHCERMKQAIYALLRRKGIAR